MKKLPVVLALALVASLAFAATAPAKTLTVCKRGCKYKKLQQAADAAKKNDTIAIRPGRYTEGILLKGKKKNSVKVRGIGRSPSQVVLEGRGAKDKQGNRIQDGVKIDGANNVEVSNLTAQNYPGNGVFARNCDGYNMTKLVVGFNRAYGLYAFDCKGGTMTDSVGYGQGDSAYYVGQTPFQANPKRTTIQRVVAYQNVLGYSGTNSKYVDILDSEWYNNGNGIVPNTLDSEKYEPATDLRIERNLVYWNNYNYYKAGSVVKPLPSAVGSFNYPIGIGVTLFGTTGVTVKDNKIFGNFLWGVLGVSDPTNKPAKPGQTPEATNRNNSVLANQVGVTAQPGDQNGAGDYMYDGNGQGNCFTAGAETDRFVLGTLSQAAGYPTCGPTPAVNSVNGGNFGAIVNIALKKEAQQDSWVTHVHPPFSGVIPVNGTTKRKPIDGMGG